MLKSPSFSVKNRSWLETSLPVGQIHLVVQIYSDKDADYGNDEDWHSVGCIRW